MCLILFAWQAHPTHRLVVAVNRDEFHARPAAPAGFWPDAPDVLAGRDLLAGGTWLGVARPPDGRLRFAAITNFREPSGGPVHEGPSRGALVTDFLRGSAPPLDYARGLDLPAYAGFNLLMGDADHLVYVSNRGAGPQTLAPGAYGLSNGLLDTPWPKVAEGTARLRDLVATRAPLAPDALLDLLDRRAPAADPHLPDTGVGLEMERTLSPAFIVSPRYGTRCSTALLVDHDGRTDFVERSFDARGEEVGREAFSFKATSERRGRG